MRFMIQENSAFRFYITETGKQQKHFSGTRQQSW